MSETDSRPVICIPVMICTWCLREQHFGPGPAGVIACGTDGCECWCGGDDE